jgi:hypothetical protein
VTYDIVFVAASALAIASALGVVLSVNPFYSALSLIMHLVSLATMYLLLQADFLAAAQVIVYAGAVMIMFLFVIAYLGNRADEPTRDIPLWLLVAAVGAVVLGSKRPSPRVDEPDAFPAPRTQPELELQAAVMGAETAFPVHHVPRKDEDDS